LSAEIIALPKIAAIIPAKTSGQLDYIVTSRSDLAKKVSTDDSPRYALWTFGLIVPAYYASSSQQAQHAEVVQDVSASLAKTTKDLQGLKKIIEYMPLIDLGESFKSDPDIGERLDRTHQGLNDAMEYIRYSGLPHTTDLIKMITKVNAQTLALTDDTKTAWSAEVLEIQKLILSDIESQDVQQGDSVHKLQTIGQTYEHYQ
jgi:hypothetical protein